MEIIETEDIFLKAAKRYLERKGENVNVYFKAIEIRNEMSDLCEMILALRDVGALPKQGK